MHIAKRSPRAAVKLTDAIRAVLDAQSIVVTAEATWGETMRELACDLNDLCERRTRLAKKIESVSRGAPAGKSHRQHVRLRTPNRGACAGVRSAIPTASPTAAGWPPTAHLAPVDSEIRQQSHRPQTTRR